MSEWLTITEIADKTGIANSTCRRYLQNFSEFFVVKGGGRVKKYEEESVKILISIKKLYDDGLETEEIRSRLKSDFSIVMNSNESVVKNSEEALSVATKEDVQELKQELTEMKEFQIQLIEELQKRDDYIKESLERRDRQLMEAMNRTMEAKKEMIEAATVKEENREGFFARLFGRKDK